VRVALSAAAIAFVTVATCAAASEIDRLHYFAINGSGVVSSARADEPVNPASVVKVATTLWALDELGPTHRYTTAFGVRGSWDRSTGSIDGDLVIRGADDPDFQWENAFLIARELNRMGIHSVKGAVVIRGRFWLGWEHGVERRVTDPVRLGEMMGRRFVTALDPVRWTRSHLNTWKAMCERRAWDPARRPRIEVKGGARFEADAESQPLLVHRSNPLDVVLRRFNVYSNNDIVRVADGLGSVDELETFVNRRLGLERGRGVELETASGERRNRMTVQQMVALLTELEAEAETHGLVLGRLLPVLGCDPGHTRRMFPSLSGPELAGSVVAKTGTLTHTDGGVAVLAGTFTSSVDGPVVFAIAARRAGGRLDYWRRVEQSWVLDLMRAAGGAARAPCGPELPFSDSHAEIEPVGSGEGLAAD
jgi:D-alanyl-D-alanine carboxypeptidase/D-alanyl-D-alanine-endopeptidase (penicillin-binding protein 4)